ncbi:hypothetical protein D9O50_04670 [Oxalobacteraceae bacterium CAVE-383]|nr:hypothetical protein D9O50_04670 [Oxalobacteraceae bacterium CAVE-383]
MDVAKEHRRGYCGSPEANACDDGSGLSAWNARLIDVITDCEDDARRYLDVIEKINGVRKSNALVLRYCMDDTHAHRHMALLAALHIAESRFHQAGHSAKPGDGGLAEAAGKLQRHIGLISLMMRAMLSQTELALENNIQLWDYGNSLLASLIEHRLKIAIDEAVALLHEQFSCTLATVLMAAIEPAMKSVQDRLSLRPDLPLDMKAFAGAMLGLKCSGNYGAQIVLADLASDVSQIFRIPRTICWSD